MIPSYSTKELYDKYFALGVTQYGQMTAGSFCYIGPQGIVHGTTVSMEIYDGAQLFKKSRLDKALMLIKSFRYSKTV